MVLLAAMATGAWADEVCSHIPGTPVQENVVYSCTEKGSYDLVVYCTLCGSELSREWKNDIEALGHNYLERSSIWSNVYRKWLYQLQMQKMRRMLTAHKARCAVAILSTAANCRMCQPPMACTSWTAKRSSSNAGTTTHIIKQGTFSGPLLFLYSLKVAYRSNSFTLWL